MSSTIITADAVKVEIKSNWADPWVHYPNVQPMGAEIAANGIGSMTFKVRYGFLKHPTDSAYGSQVYTVIARDWIRVSVSPYGSTDIIWQGRINVDSRQLYGNDGANPAGMQTFTAYDGAHLLEKRELTHSTLVDLAGTGYVETSGVLPFNANRNADFAQRNRSADKRTGHGGIDHYVFGFDSNGYDVNNPTGETWTNRDAAEYLISEWMNGAFSSSQQPVWTIGGMLASATAEAEPMNYGNLTTVWRMLQSLFRKEYGWGMFVIPTVVGFELVPFTLTPTNQTFGAYTIPANPNVVNINPTSAIENFNVIIERNQTDNYGKIVVQGRPMVVCRSFEYAEPPADTELLEGWTSTEQSDYESETGADAQEKDEKRRAAKYKHVYCRYVASAETARWTADHVPTINADGTLDKSTRGPIQLMEKGTLEWLPLQSGVDYTVDPPVDSNKVPEYLRPFPIFEDRLTGSLYSLDYGYEESDFHPLPNAVGGQFSGVVPHLFAYDHWTPGVDETEVGTVYATYATRFTLAFEADQRLFLEHEISGAPTNAEGIKTIQVNDAHLFYVAPGTLLPDGTTTPTGAGNGLELRNDRLKLEKVMAGAIVRYANPRSRASVSSKGLINWVGNLGAILGVLGDGTDANSMLAPITSIEWKFSPTFETTFRTGYSNGN